MNWKGLQQGKRKAKKRFPSWWRVDKSREEWNLCRLRKTTKRCSVALHGCGHLRDLEGPTYQERKMMERYSLDMEAA